ncbi:hypothetical protein QQS21_001309 [Conoideocrella luteorostrata]|uniref:Short-chain dehydrogenase n=1 Tax=Conoideocrella luteorostrata TaxID=1105319 RepID=A0AAJ0CXA7_9HYPO|nr:hypothetical protein QQS21_001309 [Conoideocrella luteorostrata]
MASRGSIIVTGANGGLGAAIVSQIIKSPDLATNYTGIYTVRKAVTATKLQTTLSKAPAEHRHETLEADLASIASTRSLAGDINDRVSKGDIPPIRALILNAGYQDHLGLTLTDDGLDPTWQVNYLANFLLSVLLLQSMDKDKGRILFIGSWGHDVDDARNEMGMKAYQDPKWRNLFPGPELLAKGKWSTPQDDPGAESGQRRYGASKLCAIMHMHELASRIAQDPPLSNISVLGIDPGAMGTGLVRRSTLFLRLLMKAIPTMAALTAGSSPNATMRPTSKSGADVIRACFEIEASKGRALYLNGTQELETAKDSRDAAKKTELWNYASKLSNINSGDTVLQNWQ